MSGHRGRAARPMTPERHAALMADVDQFREFLDGVEIVGFPKRSTEMERLRTLVERNPDAVAKFLAQLGQT